MVVHDRVVLFMLRGSSCSGKTTAAHACTTITGLVVHDFDEVGVPSCADLVWRQRATADWIGRAIDYQSRGLDLLLTGQSPLGEILTSPSARALDGIAVCLLDVKDRERLHRLDARGPGRWDLDAKRSFIQWARWHREHAADPQSRPEVITAGGWAAMRWDRWTTWTSSDPRWHTAVIDTTSQPTTDTSAEIQRWVAGGRAANASARLALAAGWDHSDQSRGRR